MILRFLPILLALLPVSLRADVPNVVADIAPVHSLVARVMDGVGEPALILEPSASPHGYALRPSDAAALQDADLVVWIGPALTPSLARSVESLAQDGRQLALMDAGGTERLHARETATFEHGKAGHGHGEHGQDGHGRDDEGHSGHGHAENGHAQHGHDGDHGHENHAEPGHHDHAHHGVYDPHVWLDPDNARVWLDLIAEHLARIDPNNAQSYRDNAAAARAELAALREEIASLLAPAQDVPFLVYHDAYQYFEHRFGIEVVGAIAISDAAAPGAARMVELRDLVEEAQPRCAFYEPQFSPKLVETLAQGTGLKSAELDPVGQSLTPGPELYPQLLRNMAQGIADCL